MFSSACAVAEHYADRHNSNDLKKIGNSKEHLTVYAKHLPAVNKISLAEVGAKAKVGRPTSRIPDLNLRKNNFLTIQRCPEFELQMLSPYCQPFNILIDTTKDRGIAYKSSVMYVWFKASYFAS
jgi:hypothetical protein